ncbi:hypothetical protein KZZ52_57185 [Dactylosporangium sp. AC04546]|uniref:hypothetical protein n=1 Tax=Dactylosporangium sp. AC04546 TaxID=2862460 RepID=UPI001EDF9B3A|nr:hypothetical protein [Dactylosporangium sp. AC04546]WVK83346.1 hypothetical protein KZZ52_57185 [Dactylosporangium sp. AC04546]
MADDEELRRILREVASAPPPAVRFPLGTLIQAAWRRVLLVALLVALAVVIAVVVWW